jgi:hypothetical protein
MIPFYFDLKQTGKAILLVKDIFHYFILLITCPFRQVILFYMNPIKIGVKLNKYMYRIIYTM